MGREAFYVKPKSDYPILDSLPALTQKSKVARMVGLSKNLDSVRQYGFTAKFYHPIPHLQVLLEGQNLDDKNISRFSLAVRSVDLPDFSAKVSHMSMMGMSGQSINYHVDKKLKIKVEELTQDNLLHKLRQVGLLHQLGDSETQTASIFQERVVQQTVISTSKAFKLKPANTPPDAPYPGFAVVGVIPPSKTTNDIKFIENNYQKAPHYTFDLRLAKYFADGELHSILDFVDCKIVGFKQSTFDYTKTNAMSEIDFEIVFDQLISVPPNEFADKTPKEVINIIDRYAGFNAYATQVNNQKAINAAQTIFVDNSNQIISP